MAYLEPSIPFEQSPNYDKGTGKYPKIGYVFHATLGKFPGAKATLKASTRKDANGVDMGRASCHLLISEKDHEWVELVKPLDIAWHAGKINAPDPIGQKALLRDTAQAYINPNQYLLGIEFCCGWDANYNGKVDFAELNLSDWQYEAAAQYLARNELIHGIKIDKNFCVGHKNLTSYKSDDMLRHVDKVVTRALEIVKSARVPDPMPVAQPSKTPEPVCIPEKDIADLKTKISNKQVIGIFQWLKKLLIK